MNFLDYLKKLPEQKLKEIKHSLQIEKEQLLDIYSTFTAFLEKNLPAILESLTSEEADIFYHAYRKNGFELETLENIDPEKQKAALFSLEQKGLCYSHKSLQRIKLSNRVFLFDEIIEILRNRFHFYLFEEIVKKIKSLKISSANKKYSEMPFDLFFYFFSYGLICKKDFVLQQFGEPAVHYFIEDGLIKESLIFFRDDSGCKVIACYELDDQKIQSNSYNIVRSISYHSRIFNDIIKLIYMITRDDILITKRGEINRKHYERLVKEIQSENILFFLIRFFTKHNFVETNSARGCITLTSKGYAFFQQNISDVYEKLLATDSNLLEIFHIIQKLGQEEFGIADIILGYLKLQLEENPNAFLNRETRRKVIQIIEILTYMGILVQKFTAEGYPIYKFNPRYKNLINEENSPQKPLLISPSMEVTVYPDELDLQTSYQLNLFLESVQFSDLFTYKITPQAIRRAIYFGLEIQDLIKALKTKSRNGLPENIETNILRWKEQYKQGIILSRILIRAPKEVLDLLSNTPEYKWLVLERLSAYLPEAPINPDNPTNQDNAQEKNEIKKPEYQYAIVRPEIYQHRILEDQGIFFLMEDEKPEF